MRPVRSVLVYLLAVFIGGALLAPWLYFLAQEAAAQGAFRGLADAPFHRFVNRSLLLLALAGVWPLMRSLGLRHWADLGLAPFRAGARSLVTGFAAGFLSLALAAAISIGSGARSIDGTITLTGLLGALAGALATASIVSVIEEFLFRGVLFGSIRRMHHWLTALFISSFVYAIVHFFAKPPSPDAVHWWTGLTTLGAMLRGFGNIEMLVPAFLNLAIAGAILAVAFQFTGTLHFSIGLHAGWIFWLAFFKAVTNGVAASSLAGSGRLIDGWAAGGVLLLLFAGLLLWFRKPERRINDSVGTNSVRV